MEDLDFVKMSSFWDLPWWNPSSWDLFGVISLYSVETCFVGLPVVLFRKHFLDWSHKLAFIYSPALWFFQYHLLIATEVGYSCQIIAQRHQDRQWFRRVMPVKFVQCTGYWTCKQNNRMKTRNSFPSLIIWVKPCIGSTYLDMKALQSKLFNPFLHCGMLFLDFYFYLCDLWTCNYCLLSFLRTGNVI